MKRISLILFFGVMSLFVNAQWMEVGVFGGVSYYTGDLNPAYHFLESHPSFGVVAKYNHGTRWAFRLGGYRGKVSGSDARSNYNPIRELSFQSHITDISAIVEFNFLDFFVGSKRDNMSTFIFVGLGAFFFEPQANGISLREIGTEGQLAGFEGRKQYTLTSFSMPFGIGFKYSISARFGISFEWGMRKTITDYLDDVSTTYYLDGDQIDPGNTAEVMSDPTFEHKPYQERGNPKTNDWYNFTGITLTYKFRLFGNKGCTDERRRVQY